MPAAVFQLADFFHEAFASSQAFRLVLRHPRFGPLRGGLRSITPTFRRKGQHPWFGLVFLPLSAPESRCLLTLPFIPLAGYRSGLSPILWSITPLAHFCDVVRANPFPLSHVSVTRRRSPEVSSTACDAQPPDIPPVSGYGLRHAWLARPAP
jgi:hypothetical protein